MESQHTIEMAMETMAGNCIRSRKIRRVWCSQRHSIKGSKENNVALWKTVWTSRERKQEEKEEGEEQKEGREEKEEQKEKKEKVEEEG